MANAIALHGVVMNPELGMFCISLRLPHKFELIHSSPLVVACAERVANEVGSLYNVQLSDPVFTTNSAKEVATLGKMFCLRLLEELHKMGYDLQVGADLTQARFAPSSSGRSPVNVPRPRWFVLLLGSRTQLS